MAEPQLSSPGHVSQRICYHHPAREAVARCPECSRYFCRECITEHDFRMVCAGCLEAMRSAGRRRAGAGGGGRFRLPVFPVLQVAVAVFAVWVLCIAFGRGLLRLPSDFHDGEVFGDMISAMYGSD